MEPKILSKKTKYKGFVDIISSKVKLPDGLIFNEEFIQVKNDSVIIVPLDSENNIYLLKEWRPAWQRRIITLPGGVLECKKEIEQARNELREEVGFDSKKIEKLITVLAGSKIKRKAHIFLARNLFKSSKEKGEDEVIDVIKLPIKEAYKLFLSGKEQTDSYTVLGIILAMSKLKVK